MANSYSTANWASRGNGASALMRGLGTIGNIGSSIGMYISKPLRDISEIGKQTGLSLGVKRANAPTFTNQQLLQMGGSKKFMAQPGVQDFTKKAKKSQKAFGKLEKEVEKPTFITKEEQGTTRIGEITKGKGSGGKSNLYDYSTALKDAAIAGSILPVTGGGGLVGAVGRGAAQGALGGVGATKGSLGTLEGMQEAFSGAAKGAAIGGTIAGASYGAKKILEGIRGLSVEKKVKTEVSRELSAMSKLEKQGIVDRARGTYLYRPGESTDQTVKRFLEMREITGMKGGTPQQVIDKLSEMVDNFGQTKDTGLSSLRIDQSSTDDIINSLANKIDKMPESQKLLDSDILAGISDDIVKQAQNGAEALDDYAISLRNGVPYKSALEGGKFMTAPITPEKQAIYDAAADSIVEYLKFLSDQGDSLYTTGKEGLSKSLNILNAKEIARGSAARGGIGAYGVFIPENILPTRGAGLLSERMVGAGKEALGSVGSKVGSLIGGLPKVTTSAQPGIFSGSSTQPLTGLFGGLGSQIPTEIGGQEGQGNLPEMTGGSLFTIDPETGYLRLSGEGQQGGGQGLLGETGGGMTVGQALSQAYSMLPNASESELMSLAKMLMSEGTPSANSLNMTQSKYYSVASAAQSASDLVGQMAQTAGQAIPGFGKEVTSAIADAFNVSDPAMLAYRNKLASIDLAVSNLIAGTNISKSEARRLRKLVPTMNDSPQEAQSKLNELMNLGESGMGITSDYLNY